MSMEVSTDLHTEELKERFVFEDSTDRHAKWLELCSGGVQSIYYSAKNPLTCPLPHPLVSYPPSLGRVSLWHS